MVNTVRKITIIRSRRPLTNNVNEELQWLGGTLGLFNLRDKDRSCFRIFIEVVKTSQAEQGISSDDLAARLNLTRGTVVHHLNKLIDSGIINANRNKYELRVSNLRALISELENDTKRIYAELSEIAENVDKKLGLK
jgi:predicted transcriptional regulator